MANSIRVPLSNNETEEYEESINVHSDGLAAAGFYVQPALTDAPHDDVVGIERRNEDHLFLKDAFGAVDLCDLRRATKGGNLDFLLENDLPSPSNLYANERVGGRVVRETWKHTETTALLKSIDYSRVAGKVVGEVRKVFDIDGVTVLAQLTVSYNREGGKVVGATVTRDI